MDLCANLQKTGFWGKQGAGCIFLAESTGRVLVAKRSIHVLEPRTWSTIGGAMDPEDNFPETTVLREVQEEIGWDSHNQNFSIIPLLTFNAHRGGEIVFQYHNFLVIVDEEFDPVCNWEVHEAKWFTMAEAQNLKSKHPGFADLMGHTESLDIIYSFINC